ncbi:chromosome partitioning protein parb, putative [Heliomicrobium modesticaldum Ice1]|uniref:Chromosome partitioning protein parb, putative n=1 Tax=Heliobacterium modesticaldum (strain ATCC 51547 / Ice1) TaxID=498761 RepID=B0TAB2_HELMI|nr:ParB/RepB/Spo0J family partition protein [Heliomicrobium modesticaldum]ABZ83649.1 chromosome partitioning protein parb, putative [Heliomicrobium modesticaldum Ice1]
MAKKGMGRGLGKGLEALIPGITTNEELSNDSQSAMEIDLDQIEPNLDQPRKHFDHEALEELARSIAAHGVIQPLVVRPIGKDRYQLIVGERRWRACRQLGLTKVPVIIRDWDEKTVAEVALIENIQRENLNPIEEAQAFRALIDDHQMTQEQLAKRVGKSRSYIANALRLLSLPAPVQAMVSTGKLTAGHAKVIVAIDDASVQETFALKAAEENWSVRRMEEVVRQRNQEAKKDFIFDAPVAVNDESDKRDDQITPVPVQEKPRLRATPPTVNPDISAMEERLRSKLQTQVRIRANGAMGFIELCFYSSDELQRLCDHLLGNEGP